MNISVSFTGYSLHVLPRPVIVKGLFVANIQEEVARYYRIPAREMVSSRRSREVARPRQVAMYLARELTLRSLPDIGRRFGGRDHTTVIHAVRQIEKLIRTDAELRHDVKVLKARLKDFPPNSTDDVLEGK